MLLLNLVAATLGSTLPPPATAATGSAVTRPPRQAAAATPARREVLPFINDDYPRALAQARTNKTPIFIEAWAPW
jgi:hypothetical protein